MRLVRKTGMRGFGIPTPEVDLPTSGATATDVIVADRVNGTVGRQTIADSATGLSADTAGMVRPETVIEASRHRIGGTRAAVRALTATDGTAMQDIPVGG
jgi:hypothetical protein